MLSCASSVSPLVVGIFPHQLAHGVFDGTELRLLLVLQLNCSNAFTIGYQY
ncbi:hypothetical protein PMI1127 [Proteus mirabilis HI4320]|uniref:Uncharacterized protein n=1 Tax=Proteus mirabilis (strain HI4320) TaxID=529507 RepID=B4ETQ9_PROMH|nr:hypothetical protein PMI1127 [Proteus mirabilis HI4320]